MRDGLHTQYKSSTKAKACMRRNRTQQAGTNNKDADLACPAPAVSSASVKRAPLSTPVETPTPSPPPSYSIEPTPLPLPSLARNISSDPVSFPIREVSFPMLDLEACTSLAISNEITLEMTNFEPLPISKAIVKDMDLDTGLSQCSIVSDDSLFKQSMDELFLAELPEGEISDDIFAF